MSSNCRSLPLPLSGLLFLFALPLLGYGFFSGKAETPVATAALQQKVLVTRPIGEYHVGHRTVGTNPDRSQVEEDFPDVDPATWRHLKLSMLKANGKRLDIELLRHELWLEFTGATPGSVIALDLAEFGAVGPAEVTYVGPCPELEAGDGNVVTGTFRHESDGNLLRLHVEGDSEPIGVTANHLFWSEDRRDFIPAGDLIA